MMHPDEPPVKSSLTELGIELLSVITIGFLTFFLLVMLFGFLLTYSYPKNMGRYSLGNGVEVRFVAEADEFPADLLLYSIRKDGKEVASKHYLTSHHREIPLQIRTVASKDKSVLGLWADNAKVFILYHVPSGETYPSSLGSDKDRDNRDVVIKKWHARYSLLRDDHPELPVPFYFKEVTNTISAPKL